MSSKRELENRPPAAVRKGDQEKRTGRAVRPLESSFFLSKMIQARSNKPTTTTEAASKNASLNNAPSGSTIGVHFILPMALSHGIGSETHRIASLDWRTASGTCGQPEQKCSITWSPARPPSRGSRSSPEPRSACVWPLGSSVRSPHLLCKQHHARHDPAIDALCWARGFRVTSPCGTRDEAGCWQALNSRSCR